MASIYFYDTDYGDYEAFINAWEDEKRYSWTTSAPGGGTLTVSTEDGYVLESLSITIYKGKTSDEIVYEYEPDVDGLQSHTFSVAVPELRYINNGAAYATIRARQLEPELTTEQETRTEPVPYETVRQENPDLDRGLENVIQEGVEGTRTITEEVTYEDGVEIDRVVISDVVSPAPIPKIVEYGTKPIVTKETETVTEPVPYETVEIETDELPVGEVETVQQGVEGTRTITEEVTYEDGVEVDRVVISDEITTPPTDEIIWIGTREPVITTDEVVESEPIPFEIEEVEDNTLPDGEVIVEVEGVDGLKEVTYLVTYSDGEEVSREAISEEVINEPINKVVIVGTYVPSDPAWYMHRLENATSNYEHYEDLINNEDTIIIKADDGYRFYDPVTIVPSDDTPNITLIPSESKEFNSNDTVITINMADYWLEEWVTNAPANIMFIAEAEEIRKSESKVTNFVNVYDVSMSELDQLSKERFFVPTEMASEYVDYGDYIYNLYSTPFALPDELVSNTKNNIQMGNKKTSTLSNYMLDNKIHYDLGTIRVPEEFGNVYDYRDTEIFIHVPYHEQPIPIDPTYVIGEEVNLVLALDLYSGIATLAISSSKIDGGLVSREVIPLTHEIPFMRNNRDTLLKEVGNYVYNTVETPYIELVRNVPYESDSMFGKSSRDYQTIGDYTGYVEVSDSYVETNATQDERNAIHQSLQSGIIIKSPQ